MIREAKGAEDSIILNQKDVEARLMGIEVELRDNDEKERVRAEKAAGMDQHIAEVMERASYLRQEAASLKMAMSACDQEIVRVEHANHQHLSQRERLNDQLMIIAGKACQQSTEGELALQKLENEEMSLRFQLDEAK